jgi:hypothetical protein
MSKKAAAQLEPHIHTTERYRIMASSTKSAWARTGVITLAMLAATYAWMQSADHGAAATHVVEQRPTPALSEDAQQALIEQAIVSEKVDPNWAPRAEASLHSLFEESEIHSLKLLSAGCRATICRMEIAPGDSERTDDFDLSFRRMLLHMPWQGQGFGRVYDSSGSSPTAVFFLAREGASLPQPISQGVASIAFLDENGKPVRTLTADGK